MGYIVSQGIIMAQVTISAQDEWVDLNTDLGITVGTPITLTNIGTKWGVVLESDTTPTASDRGYPISNMTEGYAIMDIIPEAGNSVWIKNCLLDVKET